MNDLKGWVAGLTELALMLLALAIVLGWLVGTQRLAFVGNVTGNMMNVVKDLGANGLVGLIAAGIILWLFTGRKLS